MKKLIALFIVCLMVSCSSERKAQRHYAKALKHGLKVIQDTDTIRITTLDSFPVIKHDSIVWEKFIAYRDTVIKFNNVYVPKTRFQTRIEYKERVKIQRIKGKTITKNHEVVKYRFNWWLLLLSFFLGIFSPKLIKFVLTKHL
jgi:PBP1b-binding outer membrane lipoprotein LpoB